MCKSSVRENLLFISTLTLRLLPKGDARDEESLYWRSCDFVCGIAWLPDRGGEKRYGAGRSRPRADREVDVAVCPRPGHGECGRLRRHVHGRRTIRQRRQRDQRTRGAQENDTGSSATKC